MADNLPSQTKAQSKLPRWFRRILKTMLYIGAIFLALILFLVCYIFYLGLEEAKLVHTSTCGRYQFRVYEFESGAGYMQLLDDKNKVIEEIKFDPGLIWGPTYWEKDCRSITVSGPKGPTDMKVDK